MARRVTPSGATPPEGSNGGCPPEVYYEHHRKLTLSARVLAQAASEHQNNFKKAKADGVDIDAEKIVLKRGKRDSDENFATDDKVAEYESILGRRRQTSLFKEAEADVNEALAQRIREDDAEQEGYNAGLVKRLATDHRFDAASAEALAFARGHAKAKEFLAASGALEEQTTTAAPRRSRRAAAASEVKSAVDPVH